MENYLYHEKSCGAVIFHKFDDKYKVLLIGFLHDGKLRWGFPKGHVEKNETEIQTALREVKEEVGLDITIISDFKASTSFSCKNDTLIEAIYYCATSDSVDTFLQKDEVQDAKWLEVEEAYNLLTYECDKDVLNKIFEFFKTFYND